MDDWFSYFSQLLDGEADTTYKDYAVQNIEELDKDCSIQALQKYIFYTIKYHKVSEANGITNKME